MPDDLYIVIRHWDRFQHYADRRPIWIKNYVALLANPSYSRLTWTQRGVLHGLWLMYAETQCELPVDTAWLSRQLTGRVTRATLEALNHAGFIEFSASKPLARARVEKEEEKEKKVVRTPRSKPQTPVDRIRAMIQNGAITDAVTLEAELRAQGLNGVDEQSLRLELATVTNQPSEPTDIPEDAGPPDPDWTP